MVASRYLAFVAATAFIGMSASTATAQQVLLGINNTPAPIKTQLIKIDPATAAVTVINGNVNIGGRVALGLGFRGGKLYVHAEISNELYEIDPATGANIGAPILITGSSFPWTSGDLAFRPSDGLGFAADDGNLITFDLSQPVPSYTKISSSNGFEGLAFNPAGVLYGTAGDGYPGGASSQLFTVDQVTGAVTKIGAGTGFSGGGIAVGGLACDNAGKLFAMTTFIPAPDPKLYSIDPVTGVGTLIGTAVGALGVRGIHFVPGGSPPAQPPPTGGGGGNEGNYPGSSGPGVTGGGEGGFGFGFGGMLNVTTSRPNPILHGPLAEGNSFRVHNLSQQPRAALTDATDTGFGPLGWSLVLVLGAGVIVLIKKTA